MFTCLVPQITKLNSGQLNSKKEKDLRTKFFTASFWFWKGLPGLHCMPGTTEGEKTLPDTAAASLTILESTEAAPSLAFPTWGNINLLLSGDTRGCTIPLLPSLSSAPNMFRLVISEAEGTTPRAPILETVFPEPRGMLAVAWFDKLFLPLTSAVSESDGDGLRVGKLLISSSFGEVDWFTIAFSKIFRTEFEPGRMAAAGALDKLRPETLTEAGVAWLPVGVEVEELIPPLLGGGVFATMSELLSWDAVSSACSWTEAFQLLKSVSQKEEQQWCPSI